MVGLQVTPVPIPTATRLLRFVLQECVAFGDEESMAAYIDARPDEEYYVRLRLEPVASPEPF